MRADGVDFHVDKLRFKTLVRPEDSNLHPIEGDRRWRPARNGTEKFSDPLKGPNGSTIWVEVVDYPGHPEPVQQTVTLEFNPSHYAFGSKSQLGVAVPEIPKVLGSLSKLLRPNLFDLGDLRFAKLQRLDLAADFDLCGVPPGLITRSLESVHRSHRMVVTTRRKPGAATLYIEPGLAKANSGRAWKLRLYSKAALDGDDHRLRVELELRDRALKKFGLKFLCDIETFDPMEMFRHYWERCHLGVTIVAGSEVWTALSAEARRSGRSHREVGNTFGYLYARDVAGTSTAYSNSLRRKYERFLADAGCGAICWDHAVSGHLDLDTFSFVATPVDEVDRGRVGGRARPRRP